MNKLHPSPKIYLAVSDIAQAGRGVFAATDITSDETIEVCPIIELPAGADYEHMKATKLRDYYFMWQTKDRAVICLGFGSLYNHSYTPNATYQKNIGDQTITFRAIKAIQKDEEVTVNYNYGKPDGKSKLWIEDVPGPEQEK